MSDRFMFLLFIYLPANIISYAISASDEHKRNMRCERIDDLASNQNIAQQRNYSKIKSFLTVKVASSSRLFFPVRSLRSDVSTVLWMMIIGNPLNIGTRRRYIASYRNSNIVINEWSALVHESRWKRERSNYNDSPLVYVVVKQSESENKMKWRKFKYKQFMLQEAHYDDDFNFCLPFRIQSKFE